MAGEAPPTCQENALLRRCAPDLVLVSHEVPSDSYSREESSTTPTSATKGRWGWSPGPVATTSSSPESRVTIQELSSKVYIQRTPRDTRHQGQDKELNHPMEEEHHVSTHMPKAAPDRIEIEYLMILTWID